MKKLIIAAAVAGSAIFAQSATVGWNLAGATAYKNDAYAFFIVGQNGVTDTAQINALLSSSEASTYTSYAFGTGTIAANGVGSLSTASSTLSLDAGDYTSFFVVFDSPALVDGTTKYTIVSGQSGLTKTVTSTAATVNFASGNVSSYLSSATWSSYGAVPEPTSGLLMLVGLAGLALRRRRA